MPIATTQLWNIPPNYASTVEDTMFSSRWHSVNIGALHCSGYVWVDVG